MHVICVNVGVWCLIRVLTGANLIKIFPRLLTASWYYCGVPFIVNPVLLCMYDHCYKPTCLYYWSWSLGWCVVSRDQGAHATTLFTVSVMCWLCLGQAMVYYVLLAQVNSFEHCLGVLVHLPAWFCVTFPPPWLRLNNTFQHT